MSKRILFVSPHMIVGGVEKALLAMFSACHERGYDIDAVFVRNRGGFAADIPEYVHVAEIPVTDEEADILLGGGAHRAVKRYLRTRHPIKALRVVLRKLFRPKAIAEYLNDFDKIPSIDTHYDISVCYHMHMPFILRFVAEKTTADIKVAWIHNDFMTSGFRVGHYKKALNQYDKFFAVSEQLKEEFIALLPEFSKKTEVFHNLVDENAILKQSEEFYPPEYDKQETKILSVGRLTEQKGFDIAIKTAKLLKQNNIKFIWFIVGDGEQHDILENLITKNALRDEVHLLGVKKNPYPYMRFCDIYVQPSRHEGYCLTLSEAKILAKPIIATDFAGAREQLENNVTGIICSATTEELFQAMRDLISNTKKRESLSVSLRDAQNAKNDFDKLEKNLERSA